VSTAVGFGEQLVLNTSLAPDYFLYTNFANGVTLSETLHNGEAQKAVKGVLNTYFTHKNNVQDLSKKLKNINKYPNTDLPKELRELVRLRRGFGDAKQIRAYEKEIKKAAAYIGDLNARDVTITRDLQRSYSKLLDAVVGGDNETLESALNFAMNEKVNYINSRIARTEFAQSYEMSFQRQMEEDKEVIGFEWFLSSAHPRTDICDCYAESDMYGMGEGVYPKDAGANIPAHPNCLCTKLPIYEDKNGNTRKGQYSQKRVDKYLDGLPMSDRKRIVGAKHAVYKKDYATGLKKNGFAITAKPRMISKSIIKEAV
jgi:hypothetical protein